MKNFIRKGLFPIDPGSELPSRTGLFGTSLSVASLVSIGGRPDHSFRFRDTSQSHHERMYLEGMPYDYQRDLEYRMACNIATKSMKNGRRDNNLAFLQKLKEHGLCLLPEYVMTDFGYSIGPIMAPRPSDQEDTSYIYPSYIIWINDPSYTSFLGSPDRLELPKDVLRSSGGHPYPRPSADRDYRPRLSSGWKI